MFVLWLAGCAVLVFIFTLTVYIFCWCLNRFLFKDEEEAGHDKLFFTPLVKDVRKVRPGPGRGRRPQVRSLESLETELVSLAGLQSRATSTSTTTLARPPRLPATTPSV